MSDIFECKLPDNLNGWRPDPFPGTGDAITQGCTCPTDQAQWPRAIKFSANCPVHELETAKSN